MSDLNAIKRKHKAALTRAKKKGPREVIKVCDAALSEFEVVGYPDQWMDWERAKEDALTELRYGRETR